MRVLILLITCFITTNAIATESFFDNMLLTDEIKQKDEAEQALEDAKNLSNKRLKNIKIDSKALKKKKVVSSIHKVDDSKIETSSAPFGLLWGADKTKTTENFGVKLSTYKLEDYPFSFEANYLPQPLIGFNKVILTFGEIDALWRILAYQKPFNDDDNATKITKEYLKFSKLLEAKYGNKEEFYIPAKKIITQKSDDGKTETTTEILEEIGNPNFLSQLQSGESVLYSTFYNDKVGVVLSVNVDQEKHTFLVIDYKNLQIMEKTEEIIINTL